MPPPIDENSVIHAAYLLNVGKLRNTGRLVEPTPPAAMADDPSSAFTAIGVCVVE